ncbi:hypothetical protein AUR65_001965 [Haloferax marisrubri]|uniref:Uncharacterized protein n=1 Tax=Haloferax marisrubri TaxID=1544719 RepID=A0A2P4NVM3_9EURY|nr:hypothetical protein AUR65_001965 [Haloferax marisrubri]
MKDRSQENRPTASSASATVPAASRLPAGLGVFGEASRVHHEDERGEDHSITPDITAAGLVGGVGTPDPDRPDSVRVANRLGKPTARDPE